MSWPDAMVAISAMCCITYLIVVLVRAMVD